MTRHELVLEELIKALILEPQASDSSRLAARVKESWVRRLQALYPQTCLKMGKRCEETLRDFLLIYPPRSWNPLTFGSELPMFLRDQLTNRKLEKFLPEIADYEWSLFWVQQVPAEHKALPLYQLSPFARYLKFRYSVSEWWKTKTDKPKYESELVIISKNAKKEVVTFEPSILEAAIVDALSEMSLSLDQLGSTLSAMLPGSQLIQVEVALNGLLEKGVVRGPSVG